MRKLTALILALALCLSLSAAFAEKTITVSGSGETLVTADTAVISLGITVRDKDALKAQSDANAVIEKIRTVLIGTGFGEENISTDYISLYAVYDYSGDVEIIAGYSASSTLAVKVTDMDRVGEAIDLAFGAGANTLNGVTFSVADETEARAQSLKAAVEDAKAKAAVLAEASGLGELEIVSVQEGSVTSFDSGANNFSRKAGGGEASMDSPTVVRAAKICVSASVTIVFRVKE